MIEINNSTVSINISEDTVSKAKDSLLKRLYYARNKDTMGNYQKWLELLDMYYRGDYESMYNFIESCKGEGGATRKACLKYLENIINGGN